MNDDWAVAAGSCLLVRTQHDVSMNVDLIQFFSLLLRRGKGYDNEWVNGRLKSGAPEVQA